MCKCSELDWRGVDQTAEHHPTCQRTRGGVIERSLTFDFSAGCTVEGQFSGLENFEKALDRLQSIPSGQIVEKGIRENPGILGLSREQIQLERNVRSIIEANPDLILSVIIHALETSSPLSRRLRELLSK